MPMTLHILALILTIFWLTVIYYLVSNERKWRHLKDEEDEKHWPLHHAGHAHWNL